MSTVSIIMPCHNGGRFIAQAIESVLSQSFAGWELLVVDDGSTDSSFKIATSYAEKDNRIKVFKTEKASGSPAVPRNIGIENAKGRFIAFLDCDDMWLPQKLEKQLPLFENEDVVVVFSNYEKIDVNGNRDNRIITAPESVTYSDMLKSNFIGNLTGCYDTKKAGKVYNIVHGHEDYILWLAVLNNGLIARNCGEVTALYRVSDSGISHSKFTALQWQWDIYRNILKFPLHKSLFFFANYLVRSSFKFLK